MNYEKKRARKQEVAVRAKSGKADYGTCRILGCGRPTTSAAGKGLNRLYCRPHADHHDRHGSYLKGSYTAAYLEPHRKAARAWLVAHKGDEVVRRGIAAVDALYRSAGPHVEAFRLRGLSPTDRARAAWARLREANVDPISPLEAWLSIKEAIASDPQPENKAEYQRVQAAKVVHRMASGSHKRWEQEQLGESVTFKELHSYPASRGLVLRHIGEQLELAAALVADRYTPTVLAAPPRSARSTTVAPVRQAKTQGTRVTHLAVAKADGTIIRFTREDN